MEVRPDDDEQEQFWEVLGGILSTHCTTHEEIDDCLRCFVDTTSRSEDTNNDFPSEHDLARCCWALLDSPLFQDNKDYVRRQFVFGLLQEDDSRPLHVMAAVLLHDGRADDVTFEMMQVEGAFGHLVALIQGNTDDDTGLHRLLVQLLGEMSRIQRLSWDDLAMVEDSFIIYLFRLIEELSDDANDPYHYPIIRVLLVLNEQYMCHAVSREPVHDLDCVTGPRQTLTNRIIKVLSNHGPAYRTFGENLILLLNRESALGPQLLILKLLYLLFTTPPTYEYFYTNDLHVLVDVIVRNLLDLDPGTYDEADAQGPNSERNGARALRHTYLRVLYPLLKNTQLAQDGNHYKKHELRKLLQLLIHGSSMHFAPADETIVRLVSRCREIEWLRDDSDTPIDVPRLHMSSPPTDADLAKRLLGMNLAEAGVSNLSVVDVTAKVDKEKPMVPAPRRRGRKQQQHLSVLLKPTSITNNDEDGGRSPFEDEVNE